MAKCYRKAGADRKGNVNQMHIKVCCYWLFNGRIWMNIRVIQVFKRKEISAIFPQTFTSEALLMPRMYVEVFVD